MIRSICRLATAAAAVVAVSTAVLTAADAPTALAAPIAQGSTVQSPNLKFYYPLPAAPNPQTIEADVVVYGGTSGGVTAAVQAARMGKKAVLVEFGTHIGGLTTGGLSATDGGSAAGGLAREFYKRVGKQSGFAPAQAEKVMLDMLKEANVPLHLEHRLVAVTKDNDRITAIKCENGVTFKGKMFIDATYEGDLFAAAGCSFHVGREANSVYGETINGVQLNRGGHQFGKAVDPYVKEGDPASGLVWGVREGGPGEQGSGDKLIQAYNFRMQFEKGGLPFPKPTEYDPKRYELLLRYMKAGGGPGVYPHPGDNNNNGAFSTDHIGFNYEWPDGAEMGDPKAERGEAYFRKLYENRQKMYQDHLGYQMGLVWFLVNDPQVPAEVRQKIGQWGLARHSFEETGGWPHQLYIREGRRLVSDFVMTEQYCRGEKVAEDSIGLAQYTMDSHNTQRYVAKDKSGKAMVKNEGDVQVHIPGPYPVAYRSIVPKASEVKNLLVPVCLSSSHIAFGSIRMEPVFMVLGQSAATAAVLAIDGDIAVQQVPYEKLKEKLLADNQTLVSTGPKGTAGGGKGQGGMVVAKLPGIVVDDASADLKGEWSSGTGARQYVGVAYRHDGNQGKGEKTATFKLPVKEAGHYEVRYAYSTNPNRATNVPITISGFAGGEPKTVTLNQKEAPAIDGVWASLGTFEFAGGAEAVVQVATTGTNGHVIIDAVQLIKK